MQMRSNKAIFLQIFLKLNPIFFETSVVFRWIF